MRRYAIPIMLAAGCIEPQLVECADGLACAPGLLCDEIHHSCATPDQLSACAELADGSDCTAGAVSGGCFDGVCLARGCGNRVVEPGEVCDDGNQISGDGCRGDCQSNETCGNGVTDSGEECDDGNLVSRDGCDSRCDLEQASWTTVPIKPRALTGEYFAYDEARHRLVVPLTTVNGPTTWEWDGVVWTNYPAATPGAASAYYDPVRGHVVEISLVGNGYGLWDWDGTTWTRFDTGTSFVGFPVAITFDRARARPMVFVNHAGTAEVWTLDATLAWTKLATQPALSLSFNWTAAYDPLSSQVVVIAGAQQAAYNGSTWTTTAFTLSDTGISLAIDPNLGQLVAVENASTGSYATREANGTWLIHGTASACYDALGAGSRRVLYHDGQLRLLDTSAGRLCTYGSAWVETLLQAPVEPIAVIADPHHHRIVFLNSPDPFHGDPLDMWTYDGTWHRLPTTPMPGPRGATTIAYDETRGVTILYGNGPATIQTHDTWSFDGTSWTMLGNAGPNGQALIYDPIRRVVRLGSDSSGMMHWLDPATNQWQPDGPGIGATFVAMAWDPSNQRAVAIVQSFLGSFFFVEQVAGSWNAPPVGPSTAYTMVSDERARALVLVGSNILERRGDSWIVDATPAYLTGNISGYDPADGQLAVAVRDDISGTFVYFRERASSTPLETCEPGVDADGDGLAGCADGDCWFACPAPCPPGTTCL